MMPVRFPVRALLALPFAAAMSTDCAMGQSEDTPANEPPKLDKLASETLSRWQKLRYHLEGAGVKSVGFDIALESKGGMTGTFNTTGKYRFDGAADAPYGKLTWEDEEIESAMQRRGWNAKALARDVRAHSILMGLANTQVSSRSQANGTILIVRGGRDNRFLLFNRAGIQAGEIFGSMKKRIQYEKTGDRYLRVGESYTMPDTKGQVAITHEKIQGVLVPVRMTERVHVRGKLLSDLEFKFSGHRIKRVQPRPMTSRPSSKGRAKGSPAAIALAEKVREFAGGATAWAQVRNVSFTFAGMRSLCWERSTDRIRVEFLSKKPNHPAVIVADLRTNAELLVAPQRETTPPSNRAKAVWTNDTYWLLAPLKVLDPGVSLSIDDPVDGDGDTLTRLRLRFMPGTGLTSKNEYVLHVVRASGRILRWDYYSEADAKPRSWTFEGYRTLSGLKLALRHRGIDGAPNIDITAVSVNGTLPQNVWSREDPCLQQPASKRRKKLP